MRIIRMFNPDEYVTPDIEMWEKCRLLYHIPDTAPLRGEMHLIRDIHDDTSANLNATAYHWQQSGDRTQC
jgi:hypothetical protein